MAKFLTDERIERDRGGSVDGGGDDALGVANADIIVRLERSDGEDPVRDTYLAWAQV